jgi:transposase-like protein
MVKNTSPILKALRIAAQSEAAAVEFLEQQRWGGSPACPRCGSVNVYKMASVNGGRNKDSRWRCRDCAPTGAAKKPGRMFTVRTQTVFEESRLPLRVWVFAFWRACASKKGISALQLSREMEITHKSALFVLRRLRHGMGNDTSKLTGTVEVDEVYLGGKPRPGTSKRGRGTSRVPVLGMVERGGDVRFQVMERLTSEKLGEVLAENADLTCRLITDDFRAYRRVGRQFAGGHEVINHSIGEYARDDVHTNTIEGVFSLIRRGVMGTFHSVSRKHLANYLHEFAFRWNTRKVDDGERVGRAIRQVDGKRLRYRESVDNPPYPAALSPELLRPSAPTQADAPF